MKLTPNELAAAKRQLSRIQMQATGCAKIHDTNLSADDRNLMRKYPNHTLTAAQYIDAKDAREAASKEESLWSKRNQTA